METIREGIMSSLSSSDKISASEEVDSLESSISDYIKIPQKKLASESLADQVKRLKFDTE